MLASNFTGVEKATCFKWGKTEIFSEPWPSCQPPFFLSQARNPPGCLLRAHRGLQKIANMSTISEANEAASHLTRAFPRNRDRSVEAALFSQRPMRTTEFPHPKFCPAFYNISFQFPPPETQQKRINIKPGIGKPLSDSNTSFASDPPWRSVSLCGFPKGELHQRSATASAGPSSEQGQKRVYPKKSILVSPLLNSTN